MTDIDNITLDKNGSNSITIYTVECEDITNKLVKVIKPGQSSSNWGSGPKENRIVDLLRIEQRFKVTGHIDYADKAKLKAIQRAGGTAVMEWDSEDFDINIDKCVIKKGKRDDDSWDIDFTCVTGEDI